MSLSVAMRGAAAARPVATSRTSVFGSKPIVRRPRITCASTFFQDQTEDVPELAAKGSDEPSGNPVVVPTVVGEEATDAADAPRSTAKPPPGAMPPAGGDPEAGVFEYFRSKFDEQPEEEEATQIVAAGVLNVYATVFTLWEKLVPNKQAKILVTGAGDDVSVAAMLLDDFSDLHAVDFSEPQLEECRSNIEKGAIPGETQDRCLKLTVASLRELSTILADEGEFEAILDVERSYPTQNKNAEQRAEYLAVVSKELNKVLKMGGIMMCMTSAPITKEEMLAESAYGDSALWSAHCAPVEGADDTNIWVLQKKGSA